jgi:two-component system, OmpR family, KDP operon response regulator KdpE
LNVVYIGADVRTAEIATLALHLRWPEVTPLIATTGEEGLELVEQELPDLVLLHPDFTDLTMNTVIQGLRYFTNAPLLVLRHRGDEMEVVTSLESGADDYVRIPCDLTELMVRTWVLLRRSGTPSSHRHEEPLSSGPLFINPATYEVFLGSQPIMLTSKEFRLLHLLVKNRGAVVTRHTLEQTLWRSPADSHGLVKKYVQRLRRKLGDDAREPVWIASVHGIGYRFIGPGSTPVKLDIASAS